MINHATAAIMPHRWERMGSALILSPKILTNKKSQLWWSLTLDKGVKSLHNYIPITSSTDNGLPIESQMIN